MTLLDFEADVFAEDLGGSTAAHFTVRRRHGKIATLLECRGISVIEHSD
jgi:hypothetical protein